MANNIPPYVPSPEYLGRKRFPDNQAWRNQLNIAARDIQFTLQNLVASNYPLEASTNIGDLYRVISREIARLNMGIQSINSDGVYETTRVPFLQQVLGERLFLNDRIAPSDYNDLTYRDYLVTIKNAFLHGSTKLNLELLASHFTGLPVRIKELYLEARTPTSSVGIINTHKMLVQVFIEQVLMAGFDINSLKDKLDFFINLARPAHVLYDTDLIWTETIDINKRGDEVFGDLGGGCLPTYDVIPFADTVAAQIISILPTSMGSTGQILSVVPIDNVFYIDTGSLRVIVEPGVNGTKIFNTNGHRVDFSAFVVGQYVKIASQPVSGEFKFWWLPDVLVGANYYTQFYKSVYQLPAFQENVKKVMDSHGRFSDQTKISNSTLCDRWVLDPLEPLYEDLRKPCFSGSDHSGVYTSDLSPHMGFPRQFWPYDRSIIVDLELLGDNYIVFLPNIPVTDSTSSIGFKFDGTSLSGAITGMDASSGRVDLNTSYLYWDTSAHNPVPGDELTFNYHYDASNYDATTALVFGIGHWQMPHAPLLSDSSGNLATPSSIGLSVDGTNINGAVTQIRPLVGHININELSSFWTSSALGRLPHVGDTFRFDYTWGELYTYGLLFDDPERTMDTYTGGYSTYSMVFDGTDSTSSVLSSPEPDTIGYRWRTYLLHHSCVLNSPDTLNFNTYQKPSNRASIINQQETLNRFNEVWSAEFLYDRNPLKELNDAYLENGLDPVLKLNAGTPPFQKTFSYQPDLIYERKVQDIRTHHHPLIYSDMLLKEFPEGDGAPISSICDGAKVGFSSRLTEEIPPIMECSPWILFDTADTTSLLVSIPGGFLGVPNLRIVDKHLRDNFILRQLQPSGLSTYTYTVTTDNDNTSVTDFIMPASFTVETDYGEVDFPALPLMHDATTVATVADVSVTINGNPWPVSSIDPYTGFVQLAAFPPVVATEHIFTLTEFDVARAAILLPGIPLNPSGVTLTIVHGSSQYYGYDFYVEGRYLTWYGTSLDHLIEIGDELRVSYEVNPITASTLIFTYKILSKAIATVVSTDSRIMDDGFVFGGPCFDGGMKTEAGWKLEEYIAGISDYSEDIKINYFNPRTSSIESHVFSGPLFESYEAVEDEIGVPNSFPDAILRIKGPVNGNPLRAQSDYGILSDNLVRFRKKTFHELLPDHTFRKLKMTEILPI